MIVVYHQNNKVVKVNSANEAVSFASNTIAGVLFQLAESYPDDWLVWCAIELQPFLNESEFDTVFHHHKIMASFGCNTESYLPEAIGYVEESPFIKINKKITYPTWRMSSDVGGIHASVLLQLNGKLSSKGDFNYFLYSVAKFSMPKGLFCYSEPKLLLDNKVEISRQKANNFKLFQFVKQHFRARWVFLLLLNYVVYEKRFPLFPLIRSLFFKNRNGLTINFDSIEVQSSKKVVVTGTIDVIIPTIGRKAFLYDVLKDLAQQTHLPINVIIVEQNPNPDSISELDYISNEKWPFQIKHTFTHQAGACNARNIALSQVESEWVFMADDDIRLEKEFNQKGLDTLNKLGIQVATFGCYTREYSSHKKNKKRVQWSSFGSGCSIVKRDLLEKNKYNLRFEFGYGEDSDYGMQLRNSGADVMHIPNPEIVHLKAPIGGFRTKPKLAWQEDEIQPKPSPTVMLNKQLHLTKEQVNGYKTILFFKFYSRQKIKNPFKYFFNFQKQWKQSKFWANELKLKK